MVLEMKFCLQIAATVDEKERKEGGERLKERYEKEKYIVSCHEILRIG